MIGVIVSVLWCMIYQSNGGNHFFHGSKHSYSHHDVLNSVADRLKHTVHLHHHNYPDKKFAVSPELIAKFEYKLEYKNDIVMIQLDHENLAKDIHSIKCFDDSLHVNESEISQISLAFKGYDELLRFTNDLKHEIVSVSSSNYSFIMVSSDHNQWINCKEYMRELSLLRMCNLNDCISDYIHNYFQCNNIQTINHEDIIHNGHITFHTNSNNKNNNKNNNNYKPNYIVDTAMTDGHRRRLLSVISYDLQFETCELGTNNAYDIYVVVEGSAGKTSPHLLTYSWFGYHDQWTDNDVGNITKLHFVTYGNDSLHINEVTINNISAGGYNCSRVTYNDLSPGGCGVGTIDLVNNDYFETQQTPFCQIIPTLNISYNLRFRTCDHNGGTIGNVYVVVEGNKGKTESHLLSNQPRESSGLFTNQYYDNQWIDIDVGTIKKLHFVIYDDDDLDVDKITINERSAGYSWAGCATATYNKASIKGCGVGTILFDTDDYDETEETPLCRVIPAIDTSPYVTYKLTLETTSGATDGGPSVNEVFAVIEGINGKKTIPYSLGALSTASQKYIYKINSTNVGEIDKLYLISYMNDRMCVDNININDIYISDKWHSALCVEYELSHPAGCSVAFVDFSTDDWTQEVQVPCTIIPPLPIAINDTGRTYHIEMHVTNNLGNGGSEDQIKFFIKGLEGTETSIHNINARTAATVYLFDIFDTVDVGYIKSAHLVNFGDDDICIDKLVIDDIYIWDHCSDPLDLLCGSYCAGYNGKIFDFLDPLSTSKGCGVIDIDFLTEEATESEQSPCERLSQLGSVFEDSWAMKKLTDIMKDLPSGNKTGKATTYTGVETKQQDILKWNSTFQFSLPALSVDTTILIDNNLKLEMEFKNGTVIRYFLGMSYDAGLELIMSLNAGMDLIDIDESLFELIVWSLGFYVGPVKLGISIGLDIRGGLLVNVESTLQCTFSYNVFGDIGLEKKLNNGWTPYASMDKDYQFSCNQFTAGVTAQLFVYPVLFCRVDYVFDSKNLIAAIAKPYVEANIEFDALVNIEEPDACYLSIGANLGLQIMLATQIIDFQWELFNQKWPMFEGCLDDLLSIAVSELAQITSNKVLKIGNDSNLCSTSYSTTNRINGIVSNDNICSQTTLQYKLDTAENETYNLFGKVDTLWNGRVYPILNGCTSCDAFDNALRLIQYENYQVLKTNVDDNSVNIAVLYNSIINNYLGTGTILNCFYTILQTINDTTLRYGKSNGVIYKNCISSNEPRNRTYESVESDILFWVYNFYQMNVILARRELFAEFLIKKAFQTNVNFADLQFNSKDDNKIFYGGIWCNICNDNNICDNKIKSFELTIYGNGKKAKLRTNYIMYSISDLDIIFNNKTNITCIGDAICGNMAYTTENHGNRYYFGEIQTSCYAHTFCGNYNENNNILPLFVFNEYASNSYDDQLFEWESSIIAIDNKQYDNNCIDNKPNTFTTTQSISNTVSTIQSISTIQSNTRETANGTKKIMMHNISILIFISVFIFNFP